MIRQIKTYSRLQKIEDEAYESAVRGDLYYVMHCFIVYQGYVVVVTRDTLEDFKKGMYFISFEDFDKWTESARRQFRRDYLGKY